MFFLVTGIVAISYDKDTGYEIGSSHFLDERHFAVSCLVRFVVPKERGRNGGR